MAQRLADRVEQGRRAIAIARGPCPPLPKPPIARLCAGAEPAGGRNAKDGTRRAKGGIPLYYKNLLNT